MCVRYPLKPLVFSKQPLTHTGDPLNSPHILRAIWPNDEVAEYEFTSGLETWPDTSHGQEKALRCSYGGFIHAILGTSISWKLFKLFVPLYSAND